MQLAPRKKAKATTDTKRFFLAVVSKYETGQGFFISEIFQIDLYPPKILTKRSTDNCAFKFYGEKQ